MAPFRRRNVISALLIAGLLAAFVAAPAARRIWSGKTAGARDAAGEAAGAPLNVVERVDPNAVWVCAEPNDCIADYLAFPERAKPWRRPISAMQLENSLLNCRVHAAPDAPPSMTEDDLADAVVDKLNIAFLLRGLDARPLKATIVATDAEEHWQTLRLLFDDPYVGVFPALLLLPRGPGPHPAVLALHGHGQDAGKYAAAFRAQQFAERGFALLVPTMRGMDAGLAEDRVTRFLLRAGFSLMTIRVYETLLALKYLRWRRDIDHEAIGLIGHSGGSVTGAVAIRVTPFFKAFVYDFTGSFYHERYEKLTDENVPGLFPYGKRIADFRAACTPALEVEYGYEGNDEQIFRFFENHLR